MVGKVTLSEKEINRIIEEQAKMTGLNVMCAGAGNPHAEIAIVAEAPGVREVQARMPQVGAGGRLLWKALDKHCKIRRTDVWVTNVVKRQLLGEDENKVRINPHELNQWESLLRYELSMLPNVRYVLLLGGIALNALTGEKSIMNWRGSVLYGEPTYIIAHNPAFPIREPKWEIVFHFDIGKFGRVLKGTHRVKPIEYLINPSAIDATKYIANLARDVRPVSFDIETIGGETACVGVSNDTGSGMCINFRSAREHHYTEYEERYVRTELARLFRSKKHFVAQNGQFDCNWLAFKDGIYATCTFDTLLAHHTLYPALPHNLGFLTSQYTDHSYYKDEKKGWTEGGNIDDYWRYNIKDVCITLEVWNKIQTELHDAGLMDFFTKHVMRLQPHLVRMTQRGVRVDESKKERVVSELQQELANSLARFHSSVASATGEENYKPNPKSPTQLRELFFTKLRLVGRGDSTDETNRKRMYDHPKTTALSRAVIGNLDHYITEQKFYSTYAEMKVDDDGRIRTEYKQFGVASAPGRLSSGQTAWETGGNLQNIPVRAKDMFIADKGCRFVYFDLSQAEARVVAYLANIPKWKEQFERARLEGGYDCHRALASEMFDVPYRDVPTKDWNLDGTPTIRYIAKRCRHGLNYRMGPEELARVTGLTLNRAVEAYTLYHRTTPELRRWWELLTREVRDTKMLWSPLGRRWILLERFDEKALGPIVAFKPQSCIGDKVASVIYDAEDDADWPKNCFSVMNIHDAIIGQVPDDDKIALKALGVYKKWAETPLHIENEHLIIPAECAWSVPDGEGIHRWSSLVKIDTTGGLHG